MSAQGWQLIAKDQDVQDYCDRMMRRAVATFEESVRNMRRWLIAFYDPTLTPEQNQDLAYAAVMAGWKP